LFDRLSRLSLDLVARPDLFRFPNPVNELSARLVAAGVLLQTAGFLITRWPVFLVTLALGFVLRVLSGPRLSPLALVVTRLVVPHLRLAPKLVPGPPKRFAQGIGAVLSTGALVAWLVGAAGAALVLVGLIALAATLESVFALCIGCKVFAGLMRVHVIPESVCVECADVGARLREQLTSASAG
jgi:hypothetical protein